MKLYYQVIFTVVACLASASASFAQAAPSPTPSPSSTVSPAPTISPSPPLTPSQREEVEKVVDDKIEKSARLNDRIQSTVNTNFSWAIALLTVLIAGLGVAPIMIGVFVWLLRGSVIQQIVSETKKQLEKTIEKEVQAQLKENVEADLKQQVQVFKQELETLKLDLVNQLQSLFIAAQTEKDRIFHELSKITPSVIQAEFVAPEIQQKIQELTKQIEILSKTNPQLSLSIDDYVSQGDALYFENRLEEAIISYEKAIRIDPELFEAWIGKAKALRRLGRYEEAVTANNRAIQIRPNDSWGYFGQGYALRGLRKYQEALAFYEKTIQLEPDAFHAWIHYGYILTKLNRFEEASSSFERVSKMTPPTNFSSLYYSKAYYHLEKGEIDLAIENLRQAISLYSKMKEFAKADPDFDSIRDDQRFKQLIED